MILPDEHNVRQRSTKNKQGNSDMAYSKLEAKAKAVMPVQNFYATGIKKEKEDEYVNDSENNNEKSVSLKEVGATAINSSANKAVKIEKNSTKNTLYIAGSLILLATLGIIFRKKLFKK